MTHVPVLVHEILESFAPKPGDTLLDGTLGHGGHAKAFLDAASDTRVVGIDADPAALAAARSALAPYAERVEYIAGTFARSRELVGVRTFTHMLLDLGIGSHQLADTARGFSFQVSEGLSMRYGVAEGLPASELPGVAWLEKKLGHAPDVYEMLVGLTEAELADLIWRYGDERMSRRIAKAIKQAATSITTAAELAEVIVGALPRSYEGGRIHPATRTFQALRLATNRELESIRAVLPQAEQLLAPGGKLAVISFHSLEDREVKQFLRASTTFDVLTKKPIQASQEEKVVNPRSRSAKLRIAERTLS